MLSPEPPGAIPMSEPTISPRAVQHQSTMLSENSPMDETRSWDKQDVETPSSSSSVPLSRILNEHSRKHKLNSERSPESTCGCFREISLSSRTFLPVQDEPASVEERLMVTMANARTEEAKFSLKAKVNGWALDIAIGLQVLINALIVALSARSVQRVSIIVLGGMSTVIASYLAYARGSKEPELSSSRARELQKFLRDCESYVLDHGSETGPEHGHNINYFRGKFEELMMNDSGRALWSLLS